MPPTGKEESTESFEHNTSPLPLKNAQQPLASGVEEESNGNTEVSDNRQREVELTQMFLQLQSTAKLAPVMRNRRVMMRSPIVLAADIAEK